MVGGGQSLDKESVTKIQEEYGRVAKLCEIPKPSNSISQTFILLEGNLEKKSK